MPIRKSRRDQLSISEFLDNVHEALSSTVTILNEEMDQESLMEMTLNQVYDAYLDRNRTYLGIWSSPTYNDKTSILKTTDFSEENGYEPNDISLILSLRVGEVYSNEYGGHWVMRLPNTFDWTLFHNLKEKSDEE